MEFSLVITSAPAHRCCFQNVDCKEYEPEVRPPPVPAAMVPIPEAIVRTPQQRRADTF